MIETLELFKRISSSSMLAMNLETAYVRLVHLIFPSESTADIDPLLSNIRT